MAVPPPKHDFKTHNKKIVRYLIVRTISNFLILFALFGIFATFGPALYFESQYLLAKVFDIHYKVVGDPQVGQTTSEFTKLLERVENQNPNAGRSVLGSIIAGEKEKVLIPDSAEFSVAIPKIGANEHIIQNVDPNNEDEYLRALMKGVAHAKGSAFPGLNGTTYLFAHSADSFWNVGRYNAVFYLLNKLEKGDEIVIFYSGQRYNYKVVKSEVVNADDTHYIASNIGQGERLILQTCWPPGTAWKRLLVFAEPLK